MLDIGLAYNRYKFIGHEFLTWLWFIIEAAPQEIKAMEISPFELDIGNRIVLENKKEQNIESITIQGDAAGLEEGRLALKKGALVTELNLILRKNDQQWQFTIKGESIGFTGFKTPQTAGIESQEDLEAALLEKAYLDEEAFDIVDALYSRFIHNRLASRWEEKTVHLIKSWL